MVGGYLIEAQPDANDLEAEIARLREIARKEPGRAFLEAAQRACDETMSAQKHRIRELEAELAKANEHGASLRSEYATRRIVALLRYVAKLKAQNEQWRKAYQEASNHTLYQTTRADEAERQLAAARHGIADLQFQLADSERRLAEALCPRAAAEG